MISDEAALTALKWFFGVGGSLSGAALLVRFIIRQVTDGKIDNARGGAIADSYQQMREENKMLREAAATAYKERDEAIKRESQAVSQMGRLEQQVSHLNDQVHYLNLRVEELMMQMQDSRKGND